MIRSRAAFVVALALALAACTAPKGLQPPVRGSTPAPGDTRLFYKVHLRMQATGAESLTVARDTVLDVHEIAAERNPVAIWFLTVSVGERFILPDGRMLIFSADLAPGTYRGPGTYTIDGKTQGKVLGVETNIGSAAFLAISDLRAAPPRATRYGVLVKPCTLTFEADAARGSVRCPALGDEAAPGKTIAWNWEWERL